MEFVDRLMGEREFESFEARWRLRFMGLLALAGLPLGLASSAFYVSCGAPADVAPSMMAAVSWPIAVVLWRLTRSLRVAAHAAAVGLLLSYATGAILTGAVAYFGWLALVPLVVFFLRGLREGMVWVAITALVTLALGVALLGTDLMNDLPGSPMVRLFRLGLMTPTMVFIGLLYETSHRETMAALEKARGDAEAANVEKGRFLASVSHEIRTPLNGVLGVTEVLLAGELPPDVKDGLLTVHRSGGTLLALINDLLDVARAESGKLELIVAPFSLERLMRDTVALHRPRAKEKGVQINSAVTRGAQDVYLGDSVRLKQVLGNLLANAIKFSSGGAVTVQAETRLEGAATHLHVAVTDSGPGISEADRLKLFKPFAQLRAEHGHSGTGLGLAIVRQLVEAMGGTVAIASEPGQGATFAISVPVGIASGKGGLDDTPMPTAREMSGRVLVVDDNPINLRVAASMLQKLGVESVCEESGDAAIARLGREYFDLVLMDLQMPGSDGFETTRRLRLDGCTVPVVALTASAGAETREQCRVAGMQECLTKPLRMAQLVVVLSGYCAPRRIGA